jgi:ABC-type polysaccharide/polyol phosphate export permease
VALNPAAGILDSFQRVLALGRLPDPQLLGVSMAGTAVVAVIGYRVFKRLERNFADVV